mgnify:CR=1 FL=1
MNKLAKAILLGLATSGYVAGAPSPCPEGYTRACPDGSAFFHASASASVMPCNGMPAICVASALAPGAPEAMPAYDPQAKVPFWIRATATEPKTDVDHASSSAIDTDGESKIGTGRQLRRRRRRRRRKKTDSVRRPVRGQEGQEIAEMPKEKPRLRVGRRRRL